MRPPCVRCFLIGLASLALVARLPAQTVPLAANHGHCEFVLATPNGSDQLYLVVGSLADASRVTSVRVKSETSDGPESLPLETQVPDSAWKNHFQAQAHWLERLRRERPARDRFPPLAAPPAHKIFYLFTGDRDLDDPANYQTIQATLCAVGQKAQIYLDKDDRKLPGIDATVAAILEVFDRDIYPWAEANLGQALDVDRDGRFTIFLTNQLSGLQRGKTRIDGFVRGSDFCRDVPAPFSNHCDMLYLNAGLQPGPHLRTVLAHEFTHAVIFCEHALAGYDGSRSHQDEESWLNEGLSHLVETLNQYGWSNLDYRISAFLANPERYSLVVPDYFAAGLWREPGTRGAAFLFMRSCLNQTDTALPLRLIQSPLHGINNLETAMQKPFAQVFRQATVDVLDKRNYGRLGSDETGPILRGPRLHEVPLANGHGECKVAGTAAAYFLLKSPVGTHARIVVDAVEPVQVTLVRVSGDILERRVETRRAKPQAAIAPK